MIQIKIQLLIPFLSKSERDFSISIPDETTLGGLIHRLCEEFGSELRSQIMHSTSGGLRSELGILLNGVGVREAQTRLKDGDHLTFFLTRSGG